MLCASAAAQTSGFAVHCPHRQNSRSIAVVEISVGCSAAHSNIISDSLITPAKTASGPLNSFGRTRPFTPMTRSILPNLCCRKIVDCSHCIGKSRFCCHLSSECEYLLLQLSDNLLHRHRHRSSSDRGAAISPPAFHRTQDRQATRVQQTLRAHNDPASKVHQTCSQLSAHRQLSTTQTTSRATIPALPGCTA